MRQQQMVQALPRGVLNNFRVDPENNQIYFHCSYCGAWHPAEKYTRFCGGRGFPEGDFRGLDIRKAIS